MKFNLNGKRILKLLLYILLGLLILHLLIYGKFLYMMYYGEGMQIDNNYTITDQVINQDELNGYIPGLEKYCIEKGMNQYDISCFDWVSEDLTKGIGVKYKQGFLYKNEYLYEEDECIYNYFLEKKLIQSYDDIIFYPEYYKMNDTDFYKQDLIDYIGC